MSGLRDPLPFRYRLDSGEADEIHSVLNYAYRADIPTMERVVSGLRAENYSATQAEIDGVIARWRAAHPRITGGGESMIGPIGPGPFGPGPEDDDAE